ncbi:hypothetical protein XHV734_1628 [Xanthomonas hortorum pv. vitians]|nr:hypothetical protein XHV734_1628 [Xanthomonas hortorum pv. vitians]
MRVRASSNAGLHAARLYPFESTALWRGRARGCARTLIRPSGTFSRREKGCAVRLRVHMSEVLRSAFYESARLQTSTLHLSKPTPGSTPTPGHL